jgi:hypothetical protein
MVTIFGSERFGWNAQIDKREPIVLGFTRARAIRYAKGDLLQIAASTYVAYT